MFRRCLFSAFSACQGEKERERRTGVRLIQSGGEYGLDIFDPLSSGRRQSVFYLKSQPHGSAYLAGPSAASKRARSQSRCLSQTL